MIDQKNKFVGRGIKAEYVGKAQCESDAVAEVIKGRVQLLFISPESILLNPRYRNMLLSRPYKANLVALAIDEAHCTKTW